MQSSIAEGADARGKIATESGWQRFIMRNPPVPVGAINRAYDLRMKCRDHTALFDPGFKEAVTSLDQEPLVFGP